MHLKDPLVANLIIPNATVQIVLQHILLYFKTILPYTALVHTKPQCTWYYAFHSRCYPLDIPLDRNIYIPNNARHTYICLCSIEDQKIMQIFIDIKTFLHSNT